MDVNDSRAAPKSQQRRWGGVVAGLIILMAVLAALATVHTDGSYGGAFERGLDGLAAATKGEEDYDAAIEDLRSGATMGVFDHYPVFVLKAAELMKMGDDLSPDTPHHEYYRALGSRDFDEAREYAGRLDNVKLAEFMNRLTDELSQR